MAEKYPGLQALTSIRGPFAVLVVVRHCVNSVGLDQNSSAIPGIVSNAEFLLDSFFILSGFLIAMLYQDDFFSKKSPGLKRSNLRSYFVLRLARVYPLHLATLLFLGVAVLAFGPGGTPEAFTGEAFVLNLLMMHSWGFLDTLTFNYPSWTISTEWFTYLLFPFMVFFTNRLNSAFSIVLAIVVSLLTIPLFIAVTPHHGWDVQLGWGLYRNTLDFLIGCLLARLAPIVFRSSILSPRSWDTLSFVLLALALLGIQFEVPALLIVTAFTVTVLALVLGDGPFAAIMRNRRLVWFGDISFSVYLIHAPVILVVNKLAPSLRSAEMSTFITYLLVVLGITLVLASLSFRYFEMPVRRKIRDKYATGSHKVSAQPELRKGKMPFPTLPTIPLGSDGGPAGVAGQKGLGPDG